MHLPAVNTLAQHKHGVAVTVVGAAMFVLGQGINGGQMHGRWPGLENDVLDTGADLAITTDYRDVLGEILTKRMGINDVAAIFPDHKISSTGVA